MSGEENHPTQIPRTVIEKLDPGVYRRSDRSEVHRALAALNTTVPPLFVTFYEEFRGPFGSQAIGFEMADLCELKENVVSLSEACRTAYDWPDRYVVLSELYGGAVLVLDGPTDRVFEVDFDGGDQQLLAGILPATWNSFEQFLEHFFA